jgi:hypothetical protein
MAKLRLDVSGKAAKQDNRLTMTDCTINAHD